MRTDRSEGVTEDGELKDQKGSHQQFIHRRRRKVTVPFEGKKRCIQKTDSIL